ncbi:MAG: phage/plasmid primase, P4 family [Nanoarchaeota archaeon]
MKENRNLKLPKYLQNEKFRFIKLKKNSKEPVSGEHWKDHLLKYNDPELISWLKKGGNYGVVGGYGDLRILDIDNKELAESMYKRIDSFTVQTCGNLYHFYFTSEYEENHAYKNGEIRSNNLYVVGPNCYAIDKKKGHKGYYTLVKDIEIKKISKEELAILVNELKGELTEEKPIDNTRSGQEQVMVCDLRSKGKTFAQVDEYMTACRFPKWCSAPLAYKYATYDFAIGSHVKRRSKKKGNLEYGNTLDKAISILVTNKIELADKFIKIQPIYFDSYLNWWLWRNKKYCWELVDETDLLNDISKNSYASTINYKEKTELIEALRQRGRLNKPKDPPKTWVQFKDTIVDIKTKKRFPASSEYFITNPIPWKVGESGYTPTIDKIFTDWMAGQDDSWKETLLEICAYSLLPDYPLHIMFALLGSGANGKTTFAKILEKFVGKNNTSSTDIDLISELQSERAKIFKKLLCTMGEIDKGIFKQTKWLKRLSGDDSIPMRDLYKKSMDFYNYAKIIMAANKLPATPDKSKGFFRRWVCIDFKNTFENRGIKIEDTIPDVEFENLAYKCIDILYNLLYVNGKFTNQGTIEMQEQRYEERASPILEFIDKYYSKDPTSFVSLPSFCFKYNDFLKKEKMPEQSNREIASILRTNGFEIKKTFIPSSGGNTTVNHILGLKEEEDSENIMTFD